jgi:hypothetical protein
VPFFLAIKTVNRSRPSTKVHTPFKRQQQWQANSDMSFKIGSSTSRPQKISKCISAFEDDDEGYTAVPRPSGQTAAGQSTDTAGPSSSSTEANKAAAAKWIDKGSAFAEQGDTAAALRCWDQALLVGLGVVPSY